MTASRPDATEAAHLVATAERLGRAVRDGSSWRYVAWLTGMAAADVGYLAALGVADADPDVLVVSLAFVASVAGLSLGLLPGARASSAGFSRRWVTAVAAWGALYAVALVVGLLAFRAEPAFWLPAAVVTALPLVLGARAEARA